MRVVLYARVSTEEQAKHGLSIETQQERLRKWAKDNGHIVVGESVDAGISGKKPYAKRPGLMKFMEEIEGGVKVDALVFCKLDRFYRSVKLYYQAVDIMDKHGVGWIAIDEDYETITAGGRFKVNIMLSVAENEADRTAERIKVVFEHKRERGELTGGNSILPLGYRAENKKPVIDEPAAEAVRALFRHYEVHGSIHAAMDYMRDTQGYPIVMSTARKMLKNPAYTGQYKEDPFYYPVIIPTDEFAAVQNQLASRSIRKNQTNRIYLFSGLIVCRECGRNMIGHYKYAGKSGPEYYGYRCQRAFLNHMCPNRHYVSEKKLEQWLIEHVESELATKEAVASAEKQQPKKPQISRAEIQKKLDRLKDLYVDDLITKEQYKADFEKLNAQIAKLQPPPASNLPRIRKIIGSDFSQNYAAADRSQKRDMWRSIISKIEIDADKSASLYFAD